MGKGSRPAKAKNLVLVSGLADDSPSFGTAGGAAGVVVVEPPHSDAVMPLESPAAAAPEPERPVVPEPDLAELQALKEEIRQQHPSWYPEFRDTFGHQFNEQLVPDLANLSLAELGLPEGTDHDRRRREIRALAFARSYQLAQAGNAEGLRAISPDLLYFWDDRIGGLVPEPVISPNDPAPWVHSINRLRSRETSKLDSAFAGEPRFQRFVKAVKGWTNGRWGELRAAAKRVLTGQTTGKAEREARELIEAVRAAQPEAPRLWRKESAAGVAQRMGVSRDALLGHLKARVGQEVTQDLVSTSSRPNVWSGDFVWEVEPGAQAVHAYPLSHYPSESEWITAGSFRLLSVEPHGHGGIKVLVEQTGVFEEQE